MKPSNLDAVSYIVTIYDIEYHATTLSRRDFPNFRGIVKPSTPRHYLKVPCEPTEVADHLRCKFRLVSTEGAT